MSVARRFALAAAFVVAATGCSSPTADDGGTKPPPAQLQSLPRPLTTAERGAAAAGSDFSLALFREVNRRRAGKNVFMSPLSAAVALAMTAQGAAGETERGMRATLGFGDQTLAAMGDGYRGLVALLLGLDPSVTLRSANAIWYRRGLPIQPSFVNTATTVFDAQVSGADFGDATKTLAAINGWAKTQTEGKIDQVLDQVTSDQVMFLLNALYFKGAWRDRFDASLTATGPFTNANGGTARVSMMHRTGSIAWASGDGFDAVDLPYGNGAFSMTVLLPNAGRTADALATSLDSAAWKALVARLTPHEVELAMPKFTFAYEDTWNDVLTTLGMGAAFSDFADFSGMVKDVGVKIDFVKQNAYVDVNEEGTEAAAVTSIGMTTTALQLPIAMHVDRPFVFVIREKFSGAVLFVGKVDAM